MWFSEKSSFEGKSRKSKKILGSRKHFLRKSKTNQHWIVDKNRFNGFNMLSENWKFLTLVTWHWLHTSKVLKWLNSWIYWGQNKNLKTDSRHGNCLDQNSCHWQIWFVWLLSDWLQIQLVFPLLHWTNLIMDYQCNLKLIALQKPWNLLSCDIYTNENRHLRNIYHYEIQLTTTFSIYYAVVFFNKINMINTSVHTNAKIYQTRVWPHS